MIHATLNDDEKRRTYDETGIVCGGDSADFKQWTKYWRTMFPKVTKAAILAFEADYRHSDEEKSDLLRAYEVYKGNMNKVMNAVMLCSKDDLPRFVSAIQSEIKAKNLKEYDSFAKYKSLATAKKVKKTVRKRSRKKKENVSEDPFNALRDAILSRQQALGPSKSKREREFDLMTDRLAAKYGSKKTTKSKKQKTGPTEEEFRAIQARMKARSK